MTPADLRAWQLKMGYTYDTASEALGVDGATYARWLEKGASLTVALACSAPAAGLKPWPGELGSHVQTLKEKKNDISA